MKKIRAQKKKRNGSYIPNLVIASDRCFQDLQPRIGTNMIDYVNKYYKIYYYSLTTRNGKDYRKGSKRILKFVIFYF